ncbi:MAG: aminopeptidase P family protein [Chloroflexi bacterium]|nr:aminopeptidase P family protein [Chloroflexota bacterium]
MVKRLANLRSRLAQNSLDAVIISQAENRRYLSGFTGSAGFLIVSKQKAFLATDFRYIEQAQAQAPDFEVVRIKGDFSEWLPGLLSDTGAARLGFEAKDISFSTYKELTKGVSGTKPEAALVPTDSLVESLRSIKDEKELKHIEKAAALADAALAEVLPGVQPGISEKELAWRIESFLRRNGSEPMPFELIVASGPNSALPHARPTDKVIATGEPVMIDIGAKVNGYCSDITRTICLGAEDNTFRRIYDIVLGAQLTAMSTMQAGMSGEQADRLARTVIEQAGYGDAFGHGTGHGVGLAPHEMPRLGTKSADTLTDGMVFTVEPGIYVSGWGGVRIEDTVILENGKARTLTRARKIR